MNDRWLLAASVLVGGGAFVALPVPLAIAIVAVIASVILRNNLLVVIALGLCAASLSHRAWAELRVPYPPSIDGTATLRSDPENRGTYVRMHIEYKGKRYDATVANEKSDNLTRMLAGETVVLHGKTRKLSGLSAPSMRRRHVVARVDVDRVRFASSGGVLDRIGNGLRRTIDRGSASLSDEDRALLKGFVFGDDRDQSDISVDGMRASGLAHLLAVSGENVAFVIVLLSPLLLLMPLSCRFAFGSAFLLFFALVTRFEPSVLRATFMAIIALAGVALGRPIDGLRLIATAFVLIVLIDPMLIGSVGFLLSVGACLGISVVGKFVEPRLRGPNNLRLAVATSLGAQIGVLPIFAIVFSGVPVVSLLANVMVAPVTGPLMIWGMTGGVVAGVVSPNIASLIHVPTRAMLWWVEFVSGTASRMPFGEYRFRHLIAFAGLTMIWFVNRWHSRVVASVGVVLLVVSPVLASLMAMNRSTEFAELNGARVWRADNAVVVENSQADPVELLGDLRRHHISHIDLLISSNRAEVGSILQSKHPTMAVTSNEAQAGEIIRVGKLIVKLGSTRSRLPIEVSSAQ